MTSHSEFNSTTTATEVASAFSQEIRGKNVMIVGVSLESIGYSMALAIASGGPNLLILASRTGKKLKAAANEIAKSYPHVPVKVVVVNLSSQKSIKVAVSEILELADKIDVLINNAAVMCLQRQWTEEHIEIQFGTNHIGLFLLTNLLMSKFLNAAKHSPPGSTRIINVSSLGLRLCPIRFHDYNFEGKDMPDDEQPGPQVTEGLKSTVDGYPGYLAYGQSKTANVLFSIALTKKLASKGILSFSLHPGSILTDLSRNLDEAGLEMIRRTNPSGVWKTLDQGASTGLVAAFDPALSATPGGFLNHCQLENSLVLPHATDPAVAERLWELSEVLTGQKFGL